MRNSVHVLFVCLILVFACTSSLDSASNTILNNQSYFTTYIVFAPNELDPDKLEEFLEAESDDGRPLVSDGRLARLEDEINSNLKDYGYDTSQVDWRDRPIMAWGEDRNALPIVSPPPLPDNWSQPDFNETGWVRRAHPLLVAPGFDLNLKVPRRVSTAYFRTYFEGDPNLQYTLDLSYFGGARVFLNGAEIARGHLPEGDLTPDQRAIGYDSYKAKSRKFAPIKLPAELINEGSNVLAIEIRAPYIHPSGLVGADKRKGNNRWNVEISPHAKLDSIELVASGNGEVLPTYERPDGISFWPIDVNARTYEKDFLEPGAEPSAVRIVGARNGTFTGMVNVGSSQPLEQVKVTASPLKFEGKGAPTVLPAVKIGAIKMNLIEALANTGDHRGENKWGPETHFKEHEPSRNKTITPPSYVAEEITQSNILPSLPADSSNPFFVEVDIPDDAKPGVYRGVLTMEASGIPAKTLPLVVYVHDWSLPEPEDWVTDFWLEVSPYSIAETFSVPLWSDAHYTLIRQAYAHAGRAGADIVIIPVLQGSEFGNGEDSMIRWAGGHEVLDFTVLDRYLDIVTEELGSQPEAIVFGVMQGLLGPTSILAADGKKSVEMDDKKWKAFIETLYAYMKKRGLEKSMRWGLAWDLLNYGKADQIEFFASVAPDVKWARASHAHGFDKNFNTVSVVYFGMDGAYGGLKRKAGAAETTMGQGRGWQKDGMFVSNPRIHNTVQQVLTGYPPYAFRIFPARALELGYTGIGRFGANYWRTWAGSKVAPPSVSKGGSNKGQSRPNAELVDFPVKDFFWADVDNQVINSGQRFEMLREGIQETEARIYLQKALDSGRLSPELALEVNAVLDAHFGENAYITRRTDSYLLNDHNQRWQVRAHELFATAAKVSNSFR